MYVDRSTLQVRGKKYTRYLLRDSYREDGKVKHRTLMNLSRCRPEEIAAIELALKHKGDLSKLVNVRQQMLLAAGAVRRRGVDAVGNGQADRRGGGAGQLPRGPAGAVAGVGPRDRPGLAALGGAVGAACMRPATCWSLERFDEDDLYANLDWLAGHQAEIERRLFAHRHGQGRSRRCFSTT